MKYRLRLNKPGAKEVLRTWTDEDIFKNFSYQDPEALDPFTHSTMTRFCRNPLPIPSYWPLVRVVSASMGPFDSLPMDLLDDILLNYLDFQSLLNLMATCVRAREIIISLHEYRSLARAAPKALQTLLRTDLLRVHSAARLYTQLLSPRCRACDQPGGFLFLPTCERACLLCLHNDMDFWVMTRDEIEDYFGLSGPDLRRLPTIRAKIWLAAFRHARELAVEICGSKTVEKTFRAYRPLRIPDSRGRWRLTTEGSYDRSQFWGVASTPLPYLRQDSSVGIWSWCVGCRLRRGSRQPLRHSARGPKDRRVSKSEAILYEAELKEWTEGDLIRHAKRCDGAELVVSLRSIGSRPVNKALLWCDGT